MPLFGRAPLQVTFTDTSTPSGEATYWHWDFGDGDTSEEQNPVHMYNSVGDYTVTLNIASPKGIDTYTDTVHATGLFAYYRLDEAAGTRSDSVGSADLTDINAVGTSLGAAEFVAASEQYLVNLAAPIATGDGLTVSFWIKSAAAGLPWFPAVADIVGLVNCCVIWTGTAGQLSAAVDGTTDITLTENSALAHVDWSFVCVWYDPADGFLRSRVESYGSLAEVSVGTTIAINDITGIYVGRGLVTPAQYLSGVVGELRVYNTVLTSDERDALFALGSP